MRSYDFRLPDIGEGIAEAEIVHWHVSVGDFIDEDTPLVDMMTDKATVEMTSPVAGRLMAVGGNIGDMIAIGSTLASFSVEEEADGAAEPSAPVLAGPEKQAVAKPELIVSEPGGRAEESAENPVAPSAQVASFAEPAREGDRHQVLASPAVRQRAKDLGVDLAEVRASTTRLRHSDLDAFLQYNVHGGFRPASATREDKEVRVVGLRRRIAENMSAAKRHIPHFTYVEEINVTRLEEMREELNSGRGEKPRLTILPLLITAFCKAIPAYPMVNARYDENSGVVVQHGAIHLGVATQTEAGLMVPVVRNAEQLNLWQLAAEIARLADAARSGKARPEELSGSTITVTSLGALGGVSTTPVINRPEVAILGPNKVIEKPVLRERDVVAAKMMNLSISCDHRVVDGWDAASFVQCVKLMLEAPAQLFAL